VITSIVAFEPALPVLYRLLVAAQSGDA